MPRPRRPPRAGALTDLSPLRIFTQIVILQVAYYICASILIVFTTLVAGGKLSPDLILSWHSIRGDTTVGWTLGLCWMLNSFISVIFILLLVARSKLVLDFVMTTHFLHFIITSLYTHALPTNLLWWALQTCSAALMTFLGIWSCQRRELRPMSFGGKAKAIPGSAGDGNEESGVLPFFSRGRTKRKGRDGGGDYEMVGVKESQDGNV